MLKRYAAAALAVVALLVVFLVGRKVLRRGR
jgi:hypothetical protein